MSYYLEFSAVCLVPVYDAQTSADAVRKHRSTIEIQDRVFKYMRERIGQIDQSTTLNMADQFRGQSCES